MDPLTCDPFSPNNSVALHRYRHGAPSGPWPWMDFSRVDVTSPSIAVATVTTVASGVATDDSQGTAAVTDASIAMEWSGYPQKPFGNWTPDQVQRSEMLEKCSKTKPSKVYWMDVGDDWKFTTPDMTRGDHTSTTSEEKFWNILEEKRPPNIRVRSLFVDDLTEFVLKMLGTKYNIEPFFFTSSINWIPSRCQEAIIHRKGDHITITLSFIRTSRKSSSAAGSQSPRSTDNHMNPEAPLLLLNGDVLSIDLLAIHMVRNEESSTIISYHPEPTLPLSASAQRLHSLMRLVGDSVYWKNIFSNTQDPTFLFLAMLWYPLYAWDESLESLHNHVSLLVPDILESPVKHSCHLRVLQARLLHYEFLLDSYRASVLFIEKTPNPAMESQGIYEAQRKASNELMKKECENLLNEIDRLEKRRRTLKNRLKNLLDIVSSEQTKALIEVTNRGSATLKNSYPTTIFLPASFIASIFWINMKDINGSVSLKTLCDITFTALIVYIVATLGMHISTRLFAKYFWERGQPFSLKDAGKSISTVNQVNWGTIGDWVK